MTICVGREKVNWPKGPREAGLGRDPGAPPAGVIMSPNPSFRGPEGAVGIRSSFDGETDCHVGPEALLAMTNHGPDFS